MEKTPGWRTLAAGVIFTGILATSEALGQVRPIVVPYRGGGSSDAFPYLLGGGLLLVVLVLLLGAAVLPAVARAMDARPSEGTCFVLAILLAIGLLGVAWKPLHLSEVCVWSSAGIMGLIVLGIVGAILVYLCRGAIGLFASGQADEGASHFFILVAFGIATAVINIKTNWGFWLSLPAGIGGVTGGLMVIAVIMELVHPTRKKEKKS